MIQLCLLSVCLHSFHKLLRISLWIIKIRKCYTIFKSSFHISVKSGVLALNGILAYCIKVSQCFLELIVKFICLVNNSPHSNCAACYCSRISCRSRCVHSYDLIFNVKKLCSYLFRCRFLNFRSFLRYNNRFYLWLHSLHLSGLSRYKASVLHLISVSTDLRNISSLT